MEHAGSLVRSNIEGEWLISPWTIFKRFDTRQSRLRGLRATCYPALRPLFKVACTTDGPRRDPADYTCRANLSTRFARFFPRELESSTTKVGN